MGTPGHLTRPIERQKEETRPISARWVRKTRRKKMAETAVSPRVDEKIDRQMEYCLPALHPQNSKMTTFV